MMFPINAAGSISFMAALSLSFAAQDIALEARPELKLAWRKNLTVPFAGYAFLPPELPRGTLMVTAFDATPLFGKSGIYIGDATSTEKPVKLTGDADWPNDLTISPETWIEGYPTRLAVVGAGFLVPTHKTGGIWVLEPAVEPKYLSKAVKITADIKSYFYHIAEYKDMNGDGRLDLITARCTSGGSLGKLVWLEQPASDALSGEPWKEHFLADGPDFLFAMEPAVNDGFSADSFGLAAAEYFGEKVSFYWGNASSVVERVIDSESGPGFSCSWVDLNGDGSVELLATNHLNMGGSVFAYSFDGDLRNPSTTITKHILAAGFNAISDAKGSAAPGVAVAFQPIVGEKGRKPFIFLSNDNGNDVYLLTPLSEEPQDFDYHVQRLADIGADVGGIAIDDIDDNSMVDIFIPAYDNGEIVHYEIDYMQ